MLDYYDQFPAPAIAQAKKDIRRRIDAFIIDLSKKSNFITEEECSKIIDIAFEKHVNGDIIKYSYSGWAVYGEKEVQVDTIKEIRAFIKTRKRRKLRGFLRTSYFLLKAYRQTIEKLYAPDSNYVQTVLKKDFESRI